MTPPCRQHSECGERAVFGVRNPEADPVHPDRNRDTWYCCPGHLAGTVQEADAPEPGCVVPVTVLASPEGGTS